MPGIASFDEYIQSLPPELQQLTLKAFIGIKKIAAGELRLEWGSERASEEHALLPPTKQARDSFRVYGVQTRFCWRSLCSVL